MLILTTEFKKAFSLIELLIVIAIIGVLGSIAAPIYGDYVLKSKVAKAFPILEAMQKELMSDHVMNDGFSDTVTFFDVPLTSVSNGVLLSGNVQKMRYHKVDSNGAWVCVYLKDLEGVHASYVAPTSSGTEGIGLYAGLCSYVAYRNGILNIDVPCQDNNAWNIPKKYDPRC